MILHGEQETEVFKPLPLSGKFENRKKILGVYDKGSGALIVSEGVLYCKKTGEPICRNVQSTFIRGITGFGGERGTSVSDTTPTREPDIVNKEFIPEFQAQLYRLSGDYNPLHIDPSFSSMVGYPKPILHGLCSFGFACRAVLKHFCNNNTSLIKLIKTRFTNPVLPGSNFITRMWKENNRVYFQSFAEGSSKPALSAAYVELHPTNVSPNPPTPSIQGPTLKSKAIFDTIESKIKENPALGKQINAIYQFNLKTDNGETVSYVVDLKSNVVKQGTHPKPDCTFIVKDSDYFDIATGKLTAQNAFTQNKLKITGNIMLAQKLSLVTSGQKPKL